MNKKEIETMNRLSRDLKTRNKILNKLTWILYKKHLKFYNKSEKQIWEKIKKIDKDFGYLEDETNYILRNKEILEGIKSSLDDIKKGDYLTLEKL